MTVCIIIEDGSIVTGANSYITITEAETLLNSIGETLEDYTDTEKEQYLFKAMRTLESYRKQYQGIKVDASQSLQFPRYPVKIDGFLIASDAIPTELKMAQAVLMLLLLDGEEVQMSNDGNSILSETVGPISVTYTASGASSSEVSWPILDTYLLPLFKNNSTQLYRA